MPPTGPFRGWFGFSPFDGLLFKLNYIDFCKLYVSILKSRATGLRDRFLRVPLVPCEVFVTLKGSFG